MSAPEAQWVVVVADNEYTVDLEVLKAWVAEYRVKPTDRVRRPGSDWKQVSDYPELLITIATGDIHTPYDPIDAIFALDSHTGSVFLSKVADPGKAFDGVKQQLRYACSKVGGHAVINCQFEYRVALAEGFVGKNQVIEIFAYGTAVRFRPRATSAPTS